MPEKSLEEILKTFKLECEDILSECSDFDLIRNYAEYNGLIKKNITQITQSIKDYYLAKLPKENNLPLELQHCYMEIYRKEQNLTPLLNEVRNQAIAEMRKAIEEG